MPVLEKTFIAKLSLDPVGGNPVRVEFDPGTRVYTLTARSGVSMGDARDQIRTFLAAAVSQAERPE